MYPIERNVYLFTAAYSGCLLKIDVEHVIRFLLTVVYSLFVVMKHLKRYAYYCRSPQSAVVRSLTSSGGADGSESSSKPRCSGYVQSGVETESEAVFSAGSSSRKRHRKHRSKSPGRRENLIPHEVRRLIEYNMLEPQLAGPNGAPVDDIKYTKVETDSRLFRIRWVAPG